MRTLIQIILAWCLMVPALAGQFEDDMRDNLAATQLGDYATSIRLMLPYAEQGNPAAQFNIGLRYYGGEGVAKDYLIAADWFKKAADQGDGMAQYNLAGMYFIGQGVSRNHTIAAEWFGKAADNGVIRAQFSLGAMYANGDGMAQDYVKAYRLLHMVAYGDYKHEGQQRGTAKEYLEYIKSQMTPTQLQTVK